MRQVAPRVRDKMLPLVAGARPRQWGRVDDTILIIQPDHLGDILLSQPAVWFLRRRHPNSKLIAVVGPWSREIASLAWPVDEVVTVQFPGFTRTEKGSQLTPYVELQREASRLRTLRTRSAYVLRPDAWWAAWLASRIAPTVVTSDDPRSRQFATRHVPISNDDHAVVRAYRIVADGDTIDLPTAITAPLRVTDSPATTDETRRLLGSRGITGAYAVIHPGSGAAVKEWPAHRWQTVATAIADLSLQVIVTGSPSEADLCSTVSGGDPRCISLAGQTSERTLAAVLRDASIVLGPDCGPLHLAVAVDTPSIHLFGPSDAGRYGPWGNPERHLVVSASWRCPRCGDLSVDRQSGCGCMLAIQPDSVIDATQRLLRANAS